MEICASQFRMAVQQFTGVKDISCSLTSKNCPRCARSLNLVERIGRGSGPEGVTWRCPRKSCRNEVSLHSATFFEGTVSFFYACTLTLVYATENRQSP